MVISWIVNTLEPELKSSVAYATTTTETWNDLNERFNQGVIPLGSMNLKRNFTLVARKHVCG